MKKKNVVMLVCSILMLMMVFTGCGKKELPFEKSPENELVTEQLKYSLDNFEERKVKLGKYNDWMATGILPVSLENYFKQKEEELSKEEYEKWLVDFAYAGDCVFLFDNAFNYSKKQSNVDAITKVILTDIENYIKYTRQGVESKDLLLHEDFKKLNPRQKVKEYMDKENIVVNEIEMAKVFTDKEIFAYPFKFTVTYIMRGTVDKTPFEKEVIQDFYITLKDKDFTEIAGVKDHLETNE